MTDKQLENKRREIRLKGYGWFNGNYIKPSEEYKLLENELECIEMINSILAYNWFGATAEAVMQMEERAYHNYLEDYTAIFGRDKVVELIQGQIDSIDHIYRDVHTDSEGVSYNSIIWKDE